MCGRVDVGCRRHASDFGGWTGTLVGYWVLPEYWDTGFCFVLVNFIELEAAMLLIVEGCGSMDGVGMRTWT